MQEETIDRKNLIVMKLLHYFITEKKYNPIILQGVQDEIWLENMAEEYKIVRIVSNYIHNDEQLEFDIFKTKRILKKVKKKTLSLNMKSLSIFTDLAERVDLNQVESLVCTSIYDEEDIKKEEKITKAFPDIIKKLTFNEEGISLFAKISSDINKHNKDDAEKMDDVFKPKLPIITYILIGFLIVSFILSYYMDPSLLDLFCVHGPSIRNGEFYRLITGAFLHGDEIHLLFNCYALYIIGGQVEGFFGKSRYIAIYLLSALFGSFLSIMFSGNVPSVGASGAVFGLMGALLYFGYHYRVYLSSAVKSQIIPLIVINLIIGFTSTGIDNAAHIGGLIGGVIASIAVGVKYKSSKLEMINGWVILSIFLGFLVFMNFFYM